MVATLDTSQWMSPAQAARVANVTPLRIRQLCDAKRLRSCRTPLGRLVAREDVERFARERATRTQPPVPVA